MKNISIYTDFTNQYKWYILYKYIQNTYVLNIYIMYVFCMYIR